MPAEYSIPTEGRVMEHNPHKQQPVLFQTSKQKGNWAENIACQWLVKQKNFYTRYGEIDLIMSDSSQLIFLEVKYRKNNYFGSAEASINAQKCRRLTAAVETYLLINNYGNNQPLRFDAITVVPAQDPHLDCTINWIKNILS
ncbi:YraN family protein [Porticoccaceae bacterium]|nr:YraN family protein [Porticoccaceae bacterium]